MVWNRIFRVRLFWVKMILGNHFPPNPHVWLQRKMKFFGNSLPVDRNLHLWLGNEFTLSFSLQFISGKREREREGERKKRAQIGEREEEETSLVIAPLVNHAPRRSRLRARSLIDEQRDRRAERSSDKRARRSRSSIAPLVGRSHRSCLHRAISSSPLPCDLNLTGFDEFFCWVLFLLWMSVELIHYLHVYSWGSVWKIGHVKHFL